MIKTISALRAAFVRCCNRETGDRSYHAWFRTTPGHDGSPHVEKLGDGWQYIVTERGLQLECRTTADPNDVLYWLIRDVTFDLASHYELDHRDASVDFRRCLFAKQEELLRALSADWTARYRAEIADVLQRYPFDDGAVRPEKRQGVSNGDAGGRG